MVPTCGIKFISHSLVWDQICLKRGSNAYITYYLRASGAAADIFDLQYVDDNRRDWRRADLHASRDYVVRQRRKVLSRRLTFLRVILDSSNHGLWLRWRTVTSTTGAYLSRRLLMVILYWLTIASMNDRLIPSSVNAPVHIQNSPI